MKKIVVIFIVLSIGFFLACEKTATKPTDNYLSGKWTERLPDGMMYYAATLHSFSFKQDSFTAKIIWWTDVVVIFPGDPCFFNGYEQRYIKGKYTVSDDSIFFSGFYYDSLYQHLQPICYRSPSDAYIEKYKYIISNDSTLILNPDNEYSFGYGIILKKE